MKFFGKQHHLIEFPRRLKLTSTKQILVLIIVFSLVIRVVFCAFMGLNIPLHSDAYKYDMLAHNLMVGNGYVEEDNVPNVTRAPMFPIFLAVVYKFFGYNLMSARISGCFLGALIVLFIYLLGKESFSIKHGLLAASIASAYPLLVYVSYEVLSENLFILFLVVGIYLLILSHKRDKKYILLFSSGLVLGLSALTRPIALILPAFLIPWFFLMFRFKRGAIYYVLFLIVFLAVQAPWVIRNYITYDTIIVGTAKGGLDLWWSNNPKVMSSEKTMGRQYRYFPSQNKDYTTIVEVNRDAYKLAFSFIKKNINKIPKMIMYKQKNFWNLMVGENIYYNLMSLLTYGIILPFYIISNFRLILRVDDKIIYPLIALFFIFVTSLYYGTVRFRLPLEPFIIILGIEGILYIKNRFITTLKYRNEI